MTNHPLNSLVRGAAALAALSVPLALTLVATPAHADATTDVLTGTWGIDKVHSDIDFAIAHLVVSKVRGRFDDFDGTVKSDPTNLDNSSVNFDIKVSSIDTDQPQRDTHLKSPDFFDAATYPDITFKSTKITHQHDKFDAVGTLTMHGISKTIDLPFTLTGPVKGPDGKEHLGVETSVTINRLDYGLAWNRLIEGTALVGDNVDIVINLDLVKQ